MCVKICEKVGPDCFQVSVCRTFTFFLQQRLLFLVIRFAMMRPEVNLAKRLSKIFGLKLHGELGTRNYVPMVLVGGRVGGCGSISASFDPRLRSLHVGLSSPSLLSDSAFASSCCKLADNVLFVYKTDNKNDRILQMDRRLKKVSTTLHKRHKRRPDALSHTCERFPGELEYELVIFPVAFLHMMAQTTILHGALTQWRTNANYSTSISFERNRDSERNSSSSPPSLLHLADCSDRYPVSEHARAYA